MPFKTRKRKATAEKRRIYVGESGTVSYSKEAGDPILPGVKKESRVVSIETGEGLSVKKELTMISLLAISVIILQVLLKISNFSF